MPHRDIAMLVHNKYLGKKRAKHAPNVAAKKVARAKFNRGGLSQANVEWWSQMVTVEYERVRGLRAVNQNETGFLVGVHKTLPMTTSAFAKEWKRAMTSKKEGSS